MSGFLAGKVWRSALDGDLKPLAACLAECGNDDGSGIFPSVAYIQWMLGWSESSVRRGMKALREQRVLVAEANLTGGRGLVPVYHLDIEALPVRPAWRFSRKGIQTDTLLERVSPEAEKGVTGGGKGCQTEECNKEESLVNRKGSVSSARPCLEEVFKYCKERGGVVDPQKWFDYYSANGWRVGRNPMKDWRAAVRTWERNGYSSGKAAQLPLSTNYDPVAELRRQNGTARIDRSREQPP